MSQYSYISEETLAEALKRLKGTAGHLLKIWFVLKHMGLSIGGKPVEIDTGNSTDSLIRLYSFGSPDGELFVPFAHTKRFMTMKGDAARSIVQTNIQRWCTSDSVVTCSPTNFLNFANSPGGSVLVSTGREYPKGLGLNEDGFALSDGKRVSIPLSSFAIWYGRQTPIPSDKNAISFLIDSLRTDLYLSDAERSCIFVDDDIQAKTKKSQLSNSQILSICNSILNEDAPAISTVLSESLEQHLMRVKSMVTISEKPSWLNYSATKMLQSLVSSGAKAILLYGAPRTGKTLAIDKLVARDDSSRATIQIHDGWGYEHLIQGMRPDDKGSFHWAYGPLASAIKDSKIKVIVLEEINRTLISQSLGEVFSLVENSYRGEKNRITLRNGDSFSIPNDKLIIMTMNTIDQSTEEIDDALIGRFASVEFIPRVEDLASILTNNAVDEKTSQKLRELFIQILPIYPLGHGYFADFNSKTDPIFYYVTRIRPVLFNHLQGYKPEELSQIDNLVNGYFGA